MASVTQRSIAHTTFVEAIWLAEIWAFNKPRIISTFSVSEPFVCSFDYEGTTGLAEPLGFNATATAALEAVTLNGNFLQNDKS